MSLAKSDRRIVTGAVMGAIFLAALDVTAVAPAMPKIIGALGGGNLYAWAFSIYAVLSTTTTPVFGRLSDRHGRRPVMLSGLGLFLLGSVACALAPSMPLFLAARALQGLGAGALLPVAFTIVGDLYSLKARAKVQGYLSGVWGVASILGPLVGGSLVETAGWPWLFWLNVPIGLAAVAIIAVKLREEGYPRPGEPLDILGGTFFSGAVLLLLTGLKVGGLPGAAILAAAAGAAAVFVLRERAAKDPLFDLSLFRIPVYRAANLAGLFAGAVLLSLSAYLPVYVMNVRGGNAVLSGFVLTPMSAGWVVAAVVGSRLLVRHDFRVLTLPGLALLAAGTLGVSRIAAGTPLPLVSLMLAVCGLGFGLSLTTFLVAVQESVGTERRGQATSGIQFFRQIGGALGVALLELVFLARLKDPSLLEARPGRALAMAESVAIMDGFRAALLVAAAFAALALVGGALAPGRRVTGEKAP